MYDKDMTETNHVTYAMTLNKYIFLYKSPQKSNLYVNCGAHLIKKQDLA